MANYREDRPGAGASSQEHSAPHHRTHEELVAGFRAHIKAEQQGYRDALKWNMTPEEIISIDLHKRFNKAPRNSPEQQFFEPIYYAWNILAYDRLNRDSQYAANNVIASAYRKHPTLRLNDTQVRTLDAIAEAVGISRPRGQSEIPVPERHYYWPYGHNPPGTIDPVTGRRKV